MNKRKFEKLLKDNTNISNNFNKINNQIDYSQYSSKEKTQNKLVKFLLNKKIMAIVTSILVLGIAIPLLNPFNTPNNSVGIVLESSNNIENIASSSTQTMEAESSILETSQMEPTASTPNNDNAIYKDNLVLISVDGIIKYDKENNKKFYTDDQYDKTLPIEYTGFYELNDVIVKNFILVNDEIVYSSGSEMLGVDLPIDTRCHCELVIDIQDTSSDYQVGDVYSIEYLIF